MPEQIVITPQPVSTANTAFGATGALDLRLAFDISGYDLLDVQINVLTFGGATTLRAYPSETASRIVA